MNNNVAILLG